MGFHELYKNGVLAACQRVFGEPITWKPKAGGEYPTTGIFNEIYQSVDPDTGAIVQSYRPNLGVRLQDIPAEPVAGDKVVVRSVTYRVQECQPDGEGNLHLLLHKNA